MYIYFKSMHSVLTCEEYPQVLAVDQMKLEKLEYRCNKWEKKETGDGAFTLSYKYEKELCKCKNTVYVHLEDYNNYYCYHCGLTKHSSFEEGVELYLQNSGNMDVVCVKPIPNGSQLNEVVDYPNTYKWATMGMGEDVSCMFVLHIEHGLLSDANVALDAMHDSCYIEFTECV